MKSPVLVGLSLLSSLPHAVVLGVRLPYCANICLEPFAPSAREGGCVCFEDICQTGLQSLVQCIFTECNAELYAPAVREVTEGCVKAGYYDNIHIVTQDSATSTSADNPLSSNSDVDLELGSAAHGNTTDDTTGPQTVSLTNSYESLGNSSGTEGTQGAVPGGGPSGGPADVSGVVPPVSYSYVTANRGCMPLALASFPLVVAAQVIIVFFLA
ncbi:hypothetical protein QBC39DRAFT_386507 [Podospora conica]|nr:hypothetical protein QBC39DRAFT_386507 [Schizothecium conicum]